MIYHVIYLIAPGLNRFYSGHFQNTPNIKTFLAMLRVGLILKADSHVAVRLPIRIRRPINGLIFIKTDYLLLLF